MSAVSSTSTNVSTLTSALSNLSLPELPDFIDLSNPNVLKPFLAENVQANPQCVAKAVEIAREIYEAKSRGIKDSKYGSTFPMNPEVLAYAMQKAKEEVVLEIAGAGGENAALLAFAGAKQVIMNDIDPAEMRGFEQLKQSLPSQVASKIESCEGNCLDLLKMKPEIKGKVGLVLCRNLIHFFNAQQQAEFFQLLKEILKPGGQAIVTANTVYFSENSRSVIEANPMDTSFKTTYCFIHDYTLSRGPKISAYNEIAPCLPEEVSNDFQAVYLYVRGAETDFKWRVDNTAFNSLPSSLRPKIREAISKYSDEIKNIKLGSVRVVTHTNQTYHSGNFTPLFEKNGFKVEQQFLLSYNGHLLPKGIDPYGNAQLIGAIITAN
jgi:SAM-dependent methyltransferase